MQNAGLKQNVRNSLWKCPFTAFWHLEKNNSGRLPWKEMFWYFKNPSPTLAFQSKVLVDLCLNLQVHSLEVPFLSKLFTNKCFPGTSHSHSMMPHPCHNERYQGLHKVVEGAWIPGFPESHLGIVIAELMAGLPSVCVTHSLKVRHEAQHWHCCSFVVLKIKVKFMENGHRSWCGGSSGCF